MYFNHRILQEARKDSIPLLERLSFLGIYSNNLDEFFRVRMASLNRLLESDNKEIRKQHDNIRKTIKTINKLNSQFSQEYTVAIDEVFKALEEHNIRLIDETQLNGEQEAYLKTYYHERLNGYTNPIWFSGIDEIGQARGQPHISPDKEDRACRRTAAAKEQPRHYQSARQGARTLRQARPRLTASTT